MKTTAHHDREQEALKAAYTARRHAIQNRLKDFASVRSDQYFYELLYCLLTPQSSAKNAERVIDKLRALDFEHKDFDPMPLLRSKEHYIRFHATKARHLIRAKQNYSDVHDILSRTQEACVLRDWMVKNVKGLGLKEASHFLRNIGRNDGLAILDRHILRSLHRLGIIRAVPKTLTRKTYLTIEKKFNGFSRQIDISLDELDLLFWSAATGEIRK